jgi:Arm DNA-binding domain
MTNCWSLSSRPRFSARFSCPRRYAMTVMRRGETWSFVAWVRDREGARRQVWRGGYRLKRDAVAAERRFLVEAEDHASEPASRIGPTLREFLEDWLVQSASTRRPTTSVSTSSASPSPRQACPRSASTTCFTPPRRWRWPLASTEGRVGAARPRVGGVHTRCLQPPRPRHARRSGHPDCRTRGQASPLTSRAAAHSAIW